MRTRVLIDECLPAALRHVFPEFDVSTVRWLGWTGRTDAQLLDLAEGRFDAILTADRSMPKQQRVIGRPFGLVIVGSTILTELAPTFDGIADAIRSIGAGGVAVVPLR